MLGIFGGMLADRFGAFRVLLVGALLYALGLGTTYAVIYGVLRRATGIWRPSTP